MCECCGDHNHSVVFNVKGMTCNHCVASVKNGVSAIKGVQNVSVDLEGGKVTVSYNPNDTKVDYIKGAIEDAGYHVE